MAKLTDYSFKGQPKNVQNFKDEVYNILNFGKVAHPVVGAVPAWNTYEGEMAFFHNTAASPSERIYVRLSSAWVLFASAFSTSGSGGLPDLPLDSIQFNSGGQFGGDAAFVMTTRNTLSVDLAGHLALGNSASVDLGPSDGLTAYDNAGLGVGSGLEAIHIQESLTDNNSFSRNHYGILTHLHVLSSPAAAPWRVEGGHFEVNIPPTYGQGGGAQTRTVYGVYAVASVNAVTVPGSIRALHALCATASTTATAAMIPIAAHIESDYDHTIGNNIAYTLLVSDKNSGTQDVSGGPAVFIATHQLQGGANRNSVRWNLRSAPPVTTGMAYNEGGTLLSGILGIGHVPQPRASFQIGNHDDQHQFVGSGGVFMWTGSTVVTSSAGDFRYDFLPDVSQGSLPYLAPPGACLVVGTAFYLVSSINSVSQLTLVNPALQTTTAGHTVKLASILVYGDGNGEGAVTEAYPFVLSQGFGRVGINVPDPTEDLDVKGNIRIRGQILYGAPAATTSRSIGVVFTGTATTTVANTAGEANLLSVGVGTTSLTANVLDTGKTLRLTAKGYYGTAAVPGTLRLRVYLGTTALLDTAANTPPGLGTNLAWEANADIACQTTGGAGIVMAQGAWPHNTTATDWVSWQMANTATVAINTTGANVLRLTALWQTADAANSISCTNATWELLG